MLLSGDVLSFFPTIPTSITTHLDNSGHIIVWDLLLHEPFQQIDASYAGPVTAVCWIKLVKDVTPGEEDSALAFTIGFWTGIIAVYKLSENVSHCLII